MTANAQDPTVEARYFDELGKPTKIERQYRDSTNIGDLYLSLHNNGFNGVRHQRWIDSDTTIDQYEYFRLPDPYANLDRYNSAAYQVISTSQDNDTLSTDWYEYDDQKIGDTTLVGHQIAEFEALQDRYFNDRLRMVLSGELIVDPNSLTPIGTWQYRWIGDLPVSLTMRNSHGGITHLKTFNGSPPTLNAHNYFVHGPDSVEHYATDSLSWDLARTTLTAIRHRFDWEETYTTTFVFSPNSRTRIDADGATIVAYSLNTKPWPVILIHAIMEEGPPVTCELMTLHTERVVRKVDPNGSESLYDYQFNDRSQPIEAQVLKDGKLLRRVEYKYAALK